MPGKQCSSEKKLKTAFAAVCTTRPVPFSCRARRAVLAVLDRLQQAESLRSRNRPDFALPIAARPLPTKADLRDEAVAALLTNDVRHLVREDMISNFMNFVAGMASGVRVTLPSATTARSLFLNLPNWTTENARKKWCRKNRIKSLMNHYEPCVSSTSEPAASCSAPPEVNLVIYRVGLGLVQTGNCWPSVKQRNPVCASSFGMYTSFTPRFKN